MKNRQQEGAGVKEEEEEVELSSPTEVWLDREVVLVDCFGEAVSRERLEQADVIGVSVRGVWFGVMLYLSCHV